jgi:tetratricopeptide (TPR) repeat protein
MAVNNPIAEAQSLIAQSRYTDALALLEQAAPTFEAVADWDNYIQCLSLQAETLSRNAQYKDALTIAQTALQIALNKFGEQHPTTAECYQNLAIEQEYSNDIDAAIKNNLKSIEIYQSIGNNYGAQIAQSLNNLGNCYRALGVFDQAIAQFKTALDLNIAALGEQNPKTAKLYNGLANCYQELCQYNMAISNYQKSLDININTLGEYHINTALAYSNMAICYTDQGNYKQSLAAHKKSIDIHTKLLGSKHLQTANAYVNISGYYNYNNEFDDAIIYLQKALSIYIEYDNKISHIAYVYNNLGVSYKGKKDFALAQKYYQQALDLYITIFGEQHFNIGISCLNIGSCWHSLGNADLAVSYTQRALNIFLQQFGEQHELIAKCYDNMGNIYKNTETSITYYEKSLSILLNLSYTDTSSLAIAYCNIATSYYDQKNYPTALANFDKTLQILCPDAASLNHYLLPSLQTNNEIDLLEVLPAKATTLAALYHQSQTPQDLTAALAYYQCADALIDQMRQSYKTEGSKLLLAEKGKTKVYDAGLEVLWAAEQHS